MPATSASPSALLRAVTGAGLPSRPLTATESISLLQALSAVPDPRRRRGRRHGLQSILLLALGAVMAGARSYAAIADWAAVAEHAVTVAVGHRTRARSGGCWAGWTWPRWKRH